MPDINVEVVQSSRPYSRAEGNTSFYPSTTQSRATIKNGSEVESPFPFEVTKPKAVPIELKAINTNPRKVILSRLMESKEKKTNFERVKLKQWTESYQPSEIV